MASDVALITMPFFDSSRPSLATGLLKAQLLRRGVSCGVHYFNLEYCRMVGWAPYRLVGTSTASLLLGEWLFAHALWGLDKERDEAYLRLFLQSVLGGKFFFREELPLEQAAAIVEKCRNTVEPFLERCLESVPWESYRVVGFSSTFQQNVASLALAKRLKERYPGLYCVFGGANCHGDMGRALFESFPFIDAVCTGEGDAAFPELAEQLLAGKPAAPIGGMLQREVSSRQLTLVGGSECADDTTPATQEVLDSFPTPNYDEFFAQHASLPTVRDETVVIPFETSRGCWWGQKHHCTFCGLNGQTMGFRERSAGRAVQEVVTLLERYGAYTRDLEAVDNILPMSYFSTFLPEIARRELGIRMFYETKANMRPEHVEILRRAGVRWIQPGIESLSTSSLKRMRKGVTALQNVQLLRLCLEQGIHVYWNYLVGFPGEADADYAGQEEFFRAISHLTPPSEPGVSRVRFDRFSPYTTEPETLGVEGLTPYPAYRFVYAGLDAPVVRRIAYFFEGRFSGDEQLIPRIEWLNKSIREWHAVHGSATLFFDEHDDALVIFDSRPAASARLTVLREPWRSLYLFCRTIRGRSSLREQWARLQAGTPAPECDFDRGLRGLVERQLLLEEEGNFLAVALSLGAEYQPPAQLREVIDDARRTALFQPSFMDKAHDTLTSIS